MNGGKVLGLIGGTGLTQLGEPAGELDLVVVGGGIYGAVAAYDAVQRGLVHGARSSTICPRSSMPADQPGGTTVVVWASVSSAGPSM